MKKLDFSNKTVVITGASRGIGEATAKEFSEAGANVALLARSKVEIDKIASNLGENSIAIVCDVSDYSQVSSAFEEVTSKFGKVDIRIGNAAVIEPIGRVTEVSPDAWGKLIDINVKGVMYGMHAALPGMVAKGGGTIITISSGAAYNALEGWSGYCTSKAATLMMTRSVDLEYRARGIRMLGLSPGTVATDMQRVIKASGVNAVSQIDWDDHIPPEWPARALLWMCTHEADPYLGIDISLRDQSIREKVGLV